jgi:hypothetical protein
MAKPSQKTFVTKDQGDPVECFGMTFPNDQARREYFLKKLKEKLKDPDFRKIEGFPVAEDEDILALPDPPFYTACPNPFINDLIRFLKKPLAVPKDPHHLEPFAADVSEGKNDPIYNVHSYHTKVPHKAIMRYILHYTQPGEVIFDGFCGTGMAGVAAQFCGDRTTVESLGLSVNTQGKILGGRGEQFSSLGCRYSVLNDLSPVATFVSHNYTSYLNAHLLESEGRRILRGVEDECGWMYLTLHNPSPNQLEKAVDFLKAGGRNLRDCTFRDFLS